MKMWKENFFTKLKCKTCYTQGFMQWSFDFKSSYMMFKTTWNWVWTCKYVCGDIQKG
jgi:hypothetical protein